MIKKCEGRKEQVYELIRRQSLNPIWRGAIGTSHLIPVCLVKNLIVYVGLGAYIHLSI